MQNKTNPRLPSYPCDPIISSKTRTRISGKEREETLNTVKQFIYCIALNEEDLGYCSVLKHNIDTGDAPPIHQLPYNSSWKERAVIQNQTEGMLRRGVIELSDSPWSSPAVLVKKRDSTWRFCVDYRKLIAVTVKDSYPLPRIAVTLSWLERATFFSSMDFQPGHHQVPVVDSDRPKTAFISADQFRTFPFCLINAPGWIESPQKSVVYRPVSQGGLGMNNTTLLYRSQFLCPIYKVLIAQQKVLCSASGYPFLSATSFSSTTETSKWQSSRDHLTFWNPCVRSRICIMAQGKPMIHGKTYRHWIQEMRSPRKIEILRTDLDWSNIWRKIAALSANIEETMFLFNQQLLPKITRCHRFDSLADENCQLCHQFPETDDRLVI
ncbi:Uncharacterized protein APZ42_015526 [Daphnia magna]|uniref:Reverse transcriptase domain-containing protein n=1 Tax=Daphnia magna TaxID=35525 RepID=A0A162NWF3_9CRUS|nr:Uncharacterized protein APZ42_015526 [Daphnia magna]